MVSIDEVKDVLKSIPHIDDGGCGIAALVMLRVYRNHGIEPKIIFGYHDDGFCDGERAHNNSAIASGNIDDVYIPPHIGLCVDGKFLDCKGGFPNKYGLVDIVNIGEKELVRMINRISGWNDWFNRKDAYNIPLIRNLVPDLL